MQRSYRIDKLFFVGALVFLIISVFFFFTKDKSTSSVNEVSPVEKHAQDLVQKCDDTKKVRATCYEESFGEITRSKGLEYSLGLLSALQQFDASSSGCHFIAHVIASEEVRKDPDNWEEVVKKVPIDACTGGFLMGILEGRSFGDDHDHVEMDEASIAQLCRLVKETGGGDISDVTCAHTMGHLVYVGVAGDVSKSVAICEQTESIYTYECLSGVFMEHEYRRNLAEHGIGKPLPWNRKTLVSQIGLCQSYNGLTAKACWREISHMFISLSQFDAAKVFDGCNAAPSEEIRDVCYMHAVGVMTLASEFDSGRLVSLCSPYKESEEKSGRCVALVVEALLGTTAQHAEKAVQFCKSVSQSSMQICYETIGKKLKPLLAEKKRSDVCKAATQKYRNTCRQ